MDFSKALAVSFVINKGFNKMETYSKTIYPSLIPASDNILNSHQTYFHFDFTGLKSGFKISKKILIDSDWFIN